MFSQDLDDVVAPYVESSCINTNSDSELDTDSETEATQQLHQRCHNPIPPLKLALFLILRIVHRVDSVLVQVTNTSPRAFLSGVGVVKLYRRFCQQAREEIQCDSQIQNWPLGDLTVKKNDRVRQCTTSIVVVVAFVTQVDFRVVLVGAAISKGSPFSAIAVLTSASVLGGLAAFVDANVDASRSKFELKLMVSLALEIGLCPFVGCCEGYLCDVCYSGHCRVPVHWSSAQEWSASKRSVLSSRARRAMHHAVSCARFASRTDI